MKQNPKLDKQAGWTLGMLLFVAVGLSPVAVSQLSAQSQREKVESGLCSRVRIEGRPFEHWTIRERMLYYQVPGVQIAVIDHGRIAWTGSYGVTRATGSQAVDDDTMFQAASVSKVVTALTVLRLVDRGSLKLDDPVAAMLKSWHLPDSSQPVTLRELLSHNAAINWPAGESALKPSQPIPSNLDRLVGRPPAENRPVVVDGVPGSGFRYSNGGYLVLGQIVTDVTGSDFSKGAYDLVLKPLGMSRSTFDVMLASKADSNLAHGHSRDGTEEPEGWRIVGMAEGGLWTTAHDLANVVLAIQQSKAGKTGFLSPQVARQMLTLQDQRWGLGVGIGGAGTNTYFEHDGSTPGYKARLFGYSNKGQSVVILTNGDRGGELIEELEYSVAAAYGWPDFKVTTHRIVPIAPEKLGSYVGQYQMAPGAFVSITAEDGKLFGEVRGRDKTELLPDGPDHFFMLNGPTVRFVRSDQGPVQELIFDGNFHATRVNEGG
jgi:CubicO group peptidase (beta-lactamase class C family)